MPLPGAFLSARAERKQRHDRGGGRFRISPPSPEPFPSFKRPKGCALLEIPVRTGNPARRTDSSTSLRMTERGGPCPPGGHSPSRVLPGHSEPRSGEESAPAWESTDSVGAHRGVGPQGLTQRTAHYHNKKRAKGKPYYVCMTEEAIKFLHIYHGKASVFLLPKEDGDAEPDVADSRRLLTSISGQRSRWSVCCTQFLLREYYPVFLNSLLILFADCVSPMFRSFYIGIKPRGHGIVTMKIQSSPFNRTVVRIVGNFH